MDDSDRNIMASLQHEACENCYFCEEHMCPQPVNGNPYGDYEFEDYYDEDREYPCHTSCLHDAYEAHLEAKAEARRESRWADQEARFNARWPR